MAGKSGLREVKTSSGLSVEYDPSAWDDMEVLDLIADLQGDDSGAAMLAVPRLLGKLFSPEQKKAIYDHVRGEDGRVPPKRVAEELIEIIQASGDGKK